MIHKTEWRFKHIYNSMIECYTADDGLAIGSGELVRGRAPGPGGLLPQPTKAASNRHETMNCPALQARVSKRALSQRRPA
jgi:hypothetical protein